MTFTKREIIGLVVFAIICLCVLSWCMFQNVTTRERMDFAFYSQGYNAGYVDGLRGKKRNITPPAIQKRRGHDI